jgi:hypothetical protein
MHVSEYVVPLVDQDFFGGRPLEVRYDGQAIAQDLVLYSGTFVNVGRRDITSDMVEQPIELQLPAGYVWLDNRVAKSTVPSVTSNAPSGNVLRLETGLWKVGERFSVEAIAIVPLSTKPGDQELICSERFEKDLQISHRIANAKQVKRATYELSRSSRMLPPVSMCVVLLLLSSFLVVLAIHPKYEVGVVVGVGEGSHTVTSKIDFLRPDTINLRSADGFKLNVDIDHVNDLLVSDRPLVRVPRDNRLPLTVTVLYVLLCVVFLIMRIVSDYNWKRFKKVIGD